MNKTFSQRLATSLAHSVFLRSGKKLHEEHPNDCDLGGSYWAKAMANLYLILNDYGEGAFPPKLTSREKTFESERQQIFESKTASFDEHVAIGMGKPATHSLTHIRAYYGAFAYIVEVLQSCGINPPARLLELGCGQGWLSELLAIRGYDVTGTSIAPMHIETAKLRIPTLHARKINCKLEFFVSPMEEVDKHVDLSKPFDAVFCFEALHHVFDWRESIAAATRCLRPGGWLLICAEPGQLHTYLAYRSSKVLKTHEIGFKAGEVVKYVKSLNYTDVKLWYPVPIDRLSQFWRFLVPFSFGDGAISGRSFWLIAKKASQ